MIGYSSIIGCSAMNYKKSDHFDGHRFHNLNHATTDKSFFELMKWLIFEESADWPKWVDDNVQPDIQRKLDSSEARVTTINHATHLIQFDGINILTDPVYSKRTSPVSWAGPKRVRAPGIAFENLPPIDVVLISHNHYDHMDLKTISRLADKHNPIFIIPIGNKKILKSTAAKNIIELDWWEHYEIPTHKTKIILTPCQHWSNRGLFDRNKALWGSFLVRTNSLQVYFGGDTGYSPHFEAIQSKFGPTDIAILPIGAYEPRWFMKEQHMNPQEAVQAHIDLKSKLSIGTHFGTFKLTNESADDPIKDLNKSLNEKNISAEKFVAPKNGQTIYFKN